MPDTARRKFRLYVDMLPDASEALIAKVKAYAEGSGPIDPSVPSLLTVGAWLPCSPVYTITEQGKAKILPPWPERGYYINYRVAADQEQSDEAEAGAP